MAAADGPVDPLTLGQQLVAILESGQRTSTYKLAVMVAILDLAVENVPADPAAEVALDLDDITARVMELYWRQLLPLDECGGVVLRQISNKTSVILTAVSRIRAAVGSTRRTVPLDVAARAAPQVYAEAHAAVKANLLLHPLKRLQNISGNAVRFLYDDSWRGDGPKRLVAENGNRLVLFPGVGATLARLAPLVKPAYQLAWVDDVRRLNAGVLDAGPDLAAHLFGTQRISLARAGNALADAFGRDCFYCAARLRDHHVDHVLPWSRVAIDGLANLVLACPACNGDKSDQLPAPTFVIRALHRQVVLDDISAEINWPTHHDRVAAASSGLYSTVTQPATTPIWMARKHVRLLADVDINFF